MDVLDLKLSVKIFLQKYFKHIYEGEYSVVIVWIYVQFPQFYELIVTE